MGDLFGEKNMSYYDDCFDHITDPVQRNSVRQQWLQMLDGGLSVADVRMLLDKYPDFRFAISRWISEKPISLGFHYGTMDRLKDFVATLPEFKDVFDKYVSKLEKEGPEKEIEKLATIFPQFKKLAEQYIKSLEETRKWLEEQREIQHQIAMREYDYAYQKWMEESQEMERKAQEQMNKYWL
jgi:DNA-binding transcriptional MerR regulator